jgi:hypothetical protein
LRQYCSPECYRKTCKRCGKTFRPTNTRAMYCSKACRIGERQCRQCGKSFTPAKNTKGRFCSLTCFYDWEVPVGTVAEGGHGYLRVKVPPGTPGANQTGRRGHWMWEQRYVMQQKLGRPLTDREMVHHINGDRTDNRPENLEVWARRQGDTPAKE